MGLDLGDAPISAQGLWAAGYRFSQSACGCREDRWAKFELSTHDIWRQYSGQHERRWSGLQWLTLSPSAWK